MYENHEELFGVGQNAVKDAQMDPDIDCSFFNEFWRHGGGGGGWYGGMSANWICEKNFGGGAGSSYAFTGNIHGQGNQDPKYALTNVDGRSNLSYGLFPRLSIDDNHLITGLETLDNKAQIPCDDYPCHGNIGNGYALIRAHKK